MKEALDLLNAKLDAIAQHQVKMAETQCLILQTLEDVVKALTQEEEEELQQDLSGNAIPRDRDQNEPL